MAEEKGSGFSVPWQAVLTLAAIVSVYFLLPPINRLRPGGAPGPSSGGLGAQDADARLWEDPVKAVARHQAALASMSERAPQDEIAASAWKARLAAERHLHDADTLKKALGEYWNSNAKVLVMPVMIQGGIYPEDSEARLRARHAVLWNLRL